MDERAYWVAISRIPGIGRVRLRRLRDQFGSLQTAWTAPESALKAAGLDTHTVGRFCAIRNETDPSREISLLSRHGITALTYEDAAYPQRLLELRDGPAVLYVRGELPTEDTPIVAVVGTRSPTTYGRQLTAEIVDGLVDHGVMVASGLARGIDTIAHRETLERNGRTLAVLACGLDMVYPSENSSLARRIISAGALVSEYAPGVKPRPESFPMRNRILSGLSQGVLVIEAGQRSGALITAHQALDQNRDVCAVPGSVLSPQSRGTNHLIRAGEARLVTCAEDVLEEIGVSVRSNPATERPHQVDTVQARILGAMGATPLHSDELARRLSIASNEVSAALALLELQGVVSNVGNMQYVVSRRWRTE
ncbi:MAG: DNA-processing protein DprA [Chloroflexota bacterium]